ncbi:hypothetical protein ACJROX_01490 [Pseudalkalibacillus sp. A8]|uniref:hypothetical protein n=1 Tax=Pseudalkalibacillus sp. A8 TaxID=3382641 RepID=UPI0038B429E6
MDNQLKDLNKSLNRMMATEERFTEKQKQNIRTAIAKKRSKRFAFLSSHWKPILSTAVCLLLFIAIAQAAMNNFSSRSLSSSGNENATLSSAIDHSGDSGSAGPDKTMPALGEEGQKDTEALPPKDDFSIAEKGDADQQKITGPLLPIDKSLVSVYEKLKTDQDQEALKGLEPFEVMQIYYHAEQQEDHETKYVMYFQDPAGSMPSKQLYLDEIAQDPVLSKNTEKKLQQIQETEKFIQMIQETPQDRKEAYITWGDTKENTQHFRLVFDESKGVWTVSWLAGQ